MRTRRTHSMRAGFTLIEVLVTLLLLALLVAVTFPVIVRQLEEGDPARAANDLANIRTGIELFQVNVRPVSPGDLEDLVHLINTTGDTDATGTLYSVAAQSRWNGPYIDAVLPEADEATGNAIETALGAQIDAELMRYDATNNCPETNAGGCTFTATNQLFLAVMVNNLDATADAAALQDINDLIDGEAETDANAPSSGRLRWNLLGDGATNVMYYLAVPL